MSLGVDRAVDAIVVATASDVGGEDDLRAEWIDLRHEAVEPSCRGSLERAARHREIRGRGEADHPDRSIRMRRTDPGLIVSRTAEVR